MPRGPQPQDARLFDEQALPRLRGAVRDLAWLLGRGYAMPSSLKLVGDRHDLVARQRDAVSRSVCSDEARQRRLATRVDDLDGKPLWIDGFNLIITVETALRGGVVMRTRDGTHRDLASVHGTYRRGEETSRALKILADALERHGAGEVRWLFDQPVSNSGRLAGWVRELVARRGVRWTADVVLDPDPLLAAAPNPVATADAEILDACGGWVDLMQWCLEDSLFHGAPPWIIDLGADPP